MITMSTFLPLYLVLVISISNCFTEGSRLNYPPTAKVPREPDVSHETQKNIICSSNGNKNFEIVGSVILKQAFALFLYDTSAGHHLVLFIPLEDAVAYIIAGTISLRNATAHSFSSAFNFDPALEKTTNSQRKIISHVNARAELIETEDRAEKTVIFLFYYDPAVSRKIDSIVVIGGNSDRNQTSRIEHRLQKPLNSKHKQAHILDHQATGLYFVQCPFEGAEKEGKDHQDLTWCVKDVEWKDDKPWFNSGNFWLAAQSAAASQSSASQVQITVVEVPIVDNSSLAAKTANETIVSLLFIDSAYVAKVLKKLAEEGGVGSGGYPVRWRKLNGFISRGGGGSGMVVLFADEHVYTFEDRYGSNRYLFSLGLSEDGEQNRTASSASSSTFPFAVFTALKVPTDRYFSCSGQVFSARLKLLLALSGSGSVEEPYFGRAALIYALFLAHFCVAGVMICAIVCMTVCEMTGDDGKLGGRSGGRGRTTEKRVRKGFRLTPPAERSGRLLVKSTSKTGKSKGSFNSKSSSSKSSPSAPSLGSKSRSQRSSKKLSAGEKTSSKKDFSSSSDRQNFGP